MDKFILNYEYLKIRMKNEILPVFVLFLVVVRCSWFMLVCVNACD